MGIHDLEGLIPSLNETYQALGGLGDLADFSVTGEGAVSATLSVGGDRILASVSGTEGLGITQAVLETSGHSTTVVLPVAVAFVTGAASTLMMKVRKTGNAVSAGFKNWLREIPLRKFAVLTSGALMTLAYSLFGDMSFFGVGFDLLAGIGTLGVAPVALSTGSTPPRRPKNVTVVVNTMDLGSLLLRMDADGFRRIRWTDLFQTSFSQQTMGDLWTTPLRNIINMNTARPLGLGMNGLLDQTVGVVLERGLQAFPKEELITRRGLAKLARLLPDSAHVEVGRASCRERV